MAQDQLTIGHASWFVKLHLIYGVVMTATTSLHFFNGDPFKWIHLGLLCIGPFFLISGIWHRKNPFVTVSEDTLTVHRMLLKNKVIPLADLTRVTSYAGDVRLFCGESKTRLDRSKIDTEDHKSLMAFLRQVVPEVEFSI